MTEQEKPPQVTVSELQKSLFVQDRKKVKQQEALLKSIFAELGITSDSREWDWGSFQAVTFYGPDNLILGSTSDNHFTNIPLEKIFEAYARGSFEPTYNEKSTTLGSSSDYKAGRVDPNHIKLVIPIPNYPGYTCKINLDTRFSEIPILRKLTYLYYYKQQNGFMSYHADKLLSPLERGLAKAQYTTERALHPERHTKEIWERKFDQVHDSLTEAIVEWSYVPVLEDTTSTQTFEDHSKLSKQWTYRVLQQIATLNIGPSEIENSLQSAKLFTVHIRLGEPPETARTVRISFKSNRYHRLRAMAQKYLGTWKDVPSYMRDQLLMPMALRVRAMAHNVPHRLNPNSEFNKYKKSEKENKKEFKTTLSEEKRVAKQIVRFMKQNERRYQEFLRDKYEPEIAREVLLLLRRINYIDIAEIPKTIDHSEHTTDVITESQLAINHDPNASEYVDIYAEIATFTGQTPIILNDDGEKPAIFLYSTRTGSPRQLPVSHAIVTADSELTSIETTLVAETNTGYVLNKDGFDPVQFFITLAEKYQQRNDTHQLFQFQGVQEWILKISSTLSFLIEKGYQQQARLFATDAHRLLNIFSMTGKGDSQRPLSSGSIYESFQEAQKKLSQSFNEVSKNTSLKQHVPALSELTMPPLFTVGIPKETAAARDSVRITLLDSHNTTEKFTTSILLSLSQKPEELVTFLKMSGAFGLTALLGEVLAGMKASAKSEVLRQYQAEARPIEQRSLPYDKPDHTPITELEKTITKLSAFSQRSNAQLCVIKDAQVTVTPL